MKRRCKNIDITSPEVVKPWVTDCLLRHRKRYDFRKLFLDFGMSKDDYNEAIHNHDKSKFMPYIDLIAIEACRQIKERNLKMTPVRIREQKDHTTMKVRLIGCECAMQQVFDYIAVYSCSDIWRCRLVPQQASSVPKRGQVYGMKMLKKYVNDDNRAIRYAKKHYLNYASKCKYVTKLDIRKCYPSARLEIFMGLFRRDCGNKDVLWLWETLLMSHRVNDYQGFMIGSLISQWGCQYMLSFAYREMMSLHYFKRGVAYKSISHAVLFMDDMTLFGSNRTQLYKAVKYMIRYIKDALGFDIKPNYAIHKLGQIDMMGYVIYRKGTVSIRSRNYIKAIRLKKRYERNGTLSVRQAKRFVSYKGFFKHSDFNKAGVFDIFRSAQEIISKKEKKNDDGESTVQRAA